MDQKKSFSKSSISIHEQLALLSKRGLVIEDQESAYHHLSTVSYYRLSGYYKVFLEPNGTSHQFQPKTSFDQIWSLYTFDRELRLIITDAIERIEIALRTALCNVLGSKYDSLWYLSKIDPFSKKWTYINPVKKKSPRDYFMKEVNDICNDKKEEFVKHYYQRYHSPNYPPIWMLIECLSFGKITSLFRYLGKLEDKKAVCQIFGYHPKVIEACLEPIRNTRNLCAHHSRIWNRWFVYTTGPIKDFGNLEITPRSLQEQIFVISKLHESISPYSNWKQRLFMLFEKYTNLIPFRSMGFKDDWKSDHFWLNTQK